MSSTPQDMFKFLSTFRTYTGYTQKNGAVSKVKKKFISHLTRAQPTPSAAATVQVSHVWVLLNCVLQQRWIGRAAKADNHLLPWPPCSPDLTPCNFFLWGFVKDSVYIPPLPRPLNKLRDQIMHALQTITADKLHRVWDEFDYRGDVCRVIPGAHIEGLWLTQKKLGQLPLLTVYVVPV